MESLKQRINRLRSLNVTRYAGAVAIVLVLLLARGSLLPWIRNGYVGTPILVAVGAAAHLFGFGPALVTLALGSVTCRYLFVPPKGSLWIVGLDSQIAFGIFIGSGLILALLIRAVQRSQSHAEEQASLCRFKQQELEQEAARREGVEATLRSSDTILRRLIARQENDKHSLCDEFHDGIIQSAMGVKMMLESLSASSVPASHWKVITDAIGYLSKGIEDGRRVLQGIRPASLDDFGLVASIEDLIRESSGNGLRITRKYDPAIGRFPETIETTIYRVVQESLHNAQKYSGSDAIQIELSQLETPDELRVVVEDYGSGFEVSAAVNGGCGLIGITERIRLAGGRSAIESAVGMGTRVSAWLPLSAGR